MEVKTMEQCKLEYFKADNDFRKAREELRRTSGAWCYKAFLNTIQDRDEVQRVTLECYDHDGWNYLRDVKLSVLEATNYGHIEYMLSKFYDHRDVEVRMTLEYKNENMGMDQKNYFELSYDGNSYSFDYNMDRLEEEE